MGAGLRPLWSKFAAATADLGSPCSSGCHRWTFGFFEVTSHDGRSFPWILGVQYRPRAFSPLYRWRLHHRYAVAGVLHDRASWRF